MVSNGFRDGLMYLLWWVVVFCWWWLALVGVVLFLPSLGWSMKPSERVWSWVRKHA